MARVKRGNVARKRRNKILRIARGFRGGNGSLFRTANQRVMKALCNAYRDRRRRKRDFRRLWIARINAAARINGLSYSRLMGGLKKLMCALTARCSLKLQSSIPPVLKRWWVPLRLDGNNTAPGLSTGLDWPAWPGGSGGSPAGIEGEER